MTEPERLAPPAQGEALGPGFGFKIQFPKSDPERVVQPMAQSLAKVYLHAIFSTKDRAPILADDWRDELFHVLGGTANNLGCQSLIAGGVAWDERYVWD
jgi:hypothetical protein